MQGDGTNLYGEMFYPTQKLSVKGVNFHEAMKLMEQGHKVHSPSAMNKDTYIRTIKDNMVNLVFIGGKAEVWVESEVDMIPCNYVFADDWYIFVIVD